MLNMYGATLNEFGDVAEQLLNNNLTQINEQLCELMDGSEQMPIGSPTVQKTVCKAVAVLQHNFAAMNFDENGCDSENRNYPLSTKPVHGQKKAGSDKKENTNGVMQSQPLYARQKLAPWVADEKNEQFLLQELRSIGLHSDGREQNNVIRLMNVFQSMHEHLTAVLPSNKLNALPSDFPYDMPKGRRATMPKSLNVRHQVQVLITKTERFLAAQRRTLESNKSLDYLKYTECDEKLNNAVARLECIKPFTTFEMRHYKGEFVNSIAKNNAAKLERSLLELRESLQTAYLYVVVFNWSMDNEYRYSLSMAQARDAVLNKAMNIVANERQLAAHPKQRSHEEQIMAERFQLDNVLQCAEEHEDFLNALLHTPEHYFRPELLAIFESSDNEATVPKNDSIASEADTLVWHILDAPSSPPRDKNRSHFPRVNRG